MPDNYIRAKKDEIRIAKVVGENDEGLTLFVPKDMQGTFKLSEGDAFLSMMFVKSDGHGGVMVWIPWEEE